MLRDVHDDIALSVDSGRPTVLVRLDLSVSFDTVGHNIPISCLYVGICTALKWFSSSLENRTFSVMTVSSSMSLPCRVPQGSVLRPVIFSLDILPLGSVFAKCNLSFHSYADDTQVFLPFK